MADQLYQNRMPVPTERVYPVECGTDHLLEAPSTELRMPIQLLQRGFAAHRFVFALGTNYAHKNRDLAIAAFQEMRRKDPDLHMVMVGAYVPFGSSRMAEARRLSEAATSNLHILSDCTSEERNWLFKHASAVLYATSAEGFGLVPYEAAQFDTPSAFVSFGPAARGGRPRPAGLRQGLVTPIAGRRHRIVAARPRPGGCPGGGRTGSGARLHLGQDGRQDGGCLPAHAQPAAPMSSPDERERPSTMPVTEPHEASTIPVDALTIAAGEDVEAVAPLPDSLPAHAVAAELSEQMDALSLRQALVDFEVANARTRDLTQRLVELAEDNQRLERELAEVREQLETERGAVD